ncbi:MAG: GGDEF domain-containing protein [Chloroflexota bacterium]
MDRRPYKVSETGLYHQEVFRILTEYELARAQRYPSPLTLLHVFLEIKENDPKTAENVRQAFSSILNTCLRVSDIPAHYGDDFVALLPVTDEIGGQAVAQRLIARLKGTRNLFDGSMYKFDIHIGISTHLGGKNISADVLLQQAQAALQMARQSGPQSYFLFSG